ncbi:hypothetical protein AAGG42_22520, partial [Stenotrophomonas maltophilia]|uniref:hypothetical protein n=1 Tax=Stenotrophomonas maltophilia TaxID=40324 RepID=UPI00314548B0
IKGSWHLIKNKNKQIKKRKKQKKKEKANQNNPKKNPKPNKKRIKKKTKQIFPMKTITPKPQTAPNARPARPINRWHKKNRTS